MNTIPEILDDEEKFLPKAIQEDAFWLRSRWYLLYAVTLLAGNYWVSMDEDSGIFRVPTHWVGLDDWRMWIEIPYMLTGIFVGLLVSLMLLRRYQHWFKALLWGGSMMGLASLLSWEWVFWTFFTYYIDALPEPFFDMEPSHFYVSVFYFLFYVVLIEILLALIRAWMIAAIKKGKSV